MQYRISTFCYIFFRFKYVYSSVFKILFYIALLNISRTGHDKAGSDAERLRKMKQEVNYIVFFRLKCGKSTWRDIEHVEQLTSGWIYETDILM